MKNITGNISLNLFAFGHHSVMEDDHWKVSRCLFFYLGNEDADDEDEFYECDEDMEEEEKSSGSRSSWDKPDGRIKRCGKLRLLKSNDQLYIPFTQEPAPMTEDRLEEHAGVLLRLGTDAMGSQLRARMMSASLLSDMESFKVAYSCQ